MDLIRCSVKFPSTDCHDLETIFYHVYRQKSEGVFGGGSTGLVLYKQ